MAIGQLSSKTTLSEADNLGLGFHFSYCGSQKKPHTPLPEPLLKPLTENNAPAIYNQGSLLTLTLQHLGTVAVATLGAIIVAIGLAILVTRPFGAEFLPLSRSLVNIGQTFPPVAVLAEVGR